MNSEYVFICKKPVSLTRGHRQRRAALSSVVILITERKFSFPFLSRFVMSLCKDGCVFQAGFIFTSNTDVSAFVQDFIKSQPAVYPGRRLPRLIFLQYIPFCSILGTKKTPGGHIVQVPYIKLIQWNYHCICLTQTEPPAAQRVSALSWEPSRGTSPLVSKS